jgi:hypothetical protein
VVQLIAASLADPTNASPLRFNVSFSEPMSAFTMALFSAAGSTAAGGSISSLAQVSPVKYQVH